jgi:hypothetical protein
MADLQETVRSAVRVAFASIGTLGKEVVLKQRVGSNFNFVGGKARVAEGEAVTIKGFLRKTLRQANSDTITAKLLLKSEDLDDPSIYDVAIFDGYSWNINPEFEDNGYVITFDLYRSQRVVL